MVSKAADCVYAFFTILQPRVHQTNHRTNEKASKKKEAFFNCLHTFLDWSVKNNYHYLAYTFINYQSDSSTAPKQMALSSTFHL